MATAIRIAPIMITDMLKLLRLQSWLSPAFPIGAFSYSHGLEWAVEEGSVRNRATLVDWLDADLRHGSARVDGVLFAEAWRSLRGQPPSPGRLAASALSRQGVGQVVPSVTSTASTCSIDDGITGAPASSSPLPSRERAAAQPPGEGGHEYAAGPSCVTETARFEDLFAIAEYAAALRGTAEFALESGQQGTAFLGTVRKAWPHPELDAIAEALGTHRIQPTLPVAAGIACAVHEIPLKAALPLYLHAWAANLVNAALRLIPLGQTDGQIAVAALEGAVAETAAEAFAADLSSIGSAAFMLDIASMRHETQYTRLFRS